MFQVQHDAERVRGERLSLGPGVGSGHGEAHVAAQELRGAQHRCLHGGVQGGLSVRDHGRAEGRVQQQRGQAQ